MAADQLQSPPAQDQEAEAAELLSFCRGLSDGEKEMLLAFLTGAKLGIGLYQR